MDQSCEFGLVFGISVKVIKNINESPIEVGYDKLEACYIFVCIDFVVGLGRLHLGCINRVENGSLNVLFIFLYKGVNGPYEAWYC